MVLASVAQGTISASDRTEVDLKRFETPFCMVGNGKHNQPFKKKLKTVRRYQRKISRKTRDFMANRAAEKKATLHGSPKWVAIKYLRHNNFSWVEVDFAFFAMTLFAEAKNLSEKNVEMVARVINNRRKDKSYMKAVTELAQFSSWYYKNQRDNSVMLCPGKEYHKHWAKIIKVAHKHFYKKDELLGSTHYFSPYNMVPRYRIPKWAKGNFAMSFGGHVFLVKENMKEALKDQFKDKKLVYIPKNARKVKIYKGEIYL